MTVGDRGSFPGGFISIVYDSSSNLLITDTLTPFEMPLSAICDPGCWEGVYSKAFGKAEDEACLWLEDPGPKHQTSRKT